MNDRSLWVYVHGNYPRVTAPSHPPPPRFVSPPPPPPVPPPQVRHDGGLPLGLDDGDTFDGACARITIGVVVEFVAWCWLSAAGLA